MKIPKQLKIGGHTIKVKITPLEGKNGESSWAKNTIYLADDIPQSQLESTLIHEIFHFLNSTLGGSQLGHGLLDSLSEQFYQVLSDNRLLK